MSKVLMFGHNLIPTQTRNMYETQHDTMTACAARPTGDQASQQARVEEEGFRAPL